MFALRGRGPALSAALSLACALALALGRPSALAQSAPFSADERRALLAFELVRREISRSEGGRTLRGGVSWQRVRAPLHEVWRVARDAQAMTQLIPSLDRVDLMGETGTTRRLLLHHSYGIGETSYAIAMVFDEADHSLHFELDPSRPHDIRAGRGHMRLTSYRGDTIVEWGMLVDPGGGVVMDLFGPMLSEWLLLPPRCMRNVVEPGREPSC